MTVSTAVAMGSEPVRLDAQAAFARWLRAQVEADGRSHRAIARARGVPANVISRVLREPSTRASERYARALATAFDADPDEIAALAGYSDVRAVVPDPRDGFATVAQWLVAARAARHVTAAAASVGAGLHRDTCRQIERYLESPPNKTTLDAFARYFGVRVGALRSLRPKSPSKVKAGRASVEKQGRDNLAAHLAEVRASGRWRPGGRTVAAMYDRRHFQELGRRSAAGRPKGSWGPCEYAECPRKDQLVYQRAYRERDGLRRFHRDCYDALRRSKPKREYSRQLGVIGEAWRRISSSSDAEVQRRLRRRMLAQLEFLRRPRRGHPPMFLRDLELARHAAELYDEVGLSTRTIGEMAGWGDYRDQRGNKAGNRWAWEMVRLGRLLRGAPAGPEQLDDGSA